MSGYWTRAGDPMVRRLIAPPVFGRTRGWIVACAPISLSIKRSRATFRTPDDMFGVKTKAWFVLDRPDLGFETVESVNPAPRCVGMMRPLTSTHANFAHSTYII